MTCPHDRATARTLRGGEGPDDAAKELNCPDCGAYGWEYCSGPPQWREPLAKSVPVTYDATYYVGYDAGIQVAMTLAATARISVSGRQECEDAMVRLEAALRSCARWIPKSRGGAGTE